ncbi:MAG: hypothetical protein ABIY55_23335 [Kofleriaceae bacterium]
MTAAFVWSMLAAVACSDSGTPTASCTTPASGPKVLCSEIDNAPGGSEGEQVKQSCAASDGSFAATACDHTGVLGGCLLAIQGATFSTITWYYPAGAVMTQADVMATCTALRATFVSP